MHPAGAGPAPSEANVPVRSIPATAEACLCTTAMALNSRKQHSKVPPRMLRSQHPKPGVCDHESAASQNTKQKPKKSSSDICTTQWQANMRAMACTWAALRISPDPEPKLPQCFTHVQ
mmetsp:Transcript_25352/g.55075  ORF Transcript_25352/g.55075 Transcript_25352/m.55075 type:complete len:118 (-) Transcript_25352:3772-4125(-)